MATWKFKEVERVLLAKGVEAEGTEGHKKYRLVARGQRTSVLTKVSHTKKKGLAENSPLWNAYKRDLHLTNSQLSRFLNCPMDGDEFVRILQATEVIQLN